MVMDEVLANKIAAGEVVEKTMNVVKELVENSIDASSHSIKIELIDSGVKEIKVTDDGVGMSQEDAVLAFSRHATSKLHSIDDLFHIGSLGFRGEALPSIASVSEVRLKTSDGNVGTEVVLHGGKIVSVLPSDERQGTSITVSNLFYNTPVRLKYLKNLYIELANITDYVNKMALSYPDVQFVLKNNGKILLNTDGSGNLLKVIHAIYGLDVTKKMIAVSNENDDYAIHGYISYPEMAKSNRQAITILVNGRVIKNNEINRVIIDSYHTYIPHDKFPIVVLNIDVDPILIDINIHPTKMDIKFSKMASLKEFLTETIQNQLEQKTFIPSVSTVSSFDMEEESTLFEEPIKVVKTVEKEERVVPSYPKIEEVSLSFEVDDQAVVLEEAKEQPRIKVMHPVGLVHGTYIVAENEDGMFLIDQHAANERINYEKYLKQMGENHHQTIEPLVPLSFEFSNSEYLVLKEQFDLISSLDFEIEEFGINTILVRRHPLWIPKGREQEAIRKILDIIIEKEEFSQEKFMEKAAIMLSCKMSIKANDHISLEEMEHLLNTLRACNNPFTCPHGRPTIITYTKYELEKLFKRAMN